MGSFGYFKIQGICASLKLFFWFQALKWKCLPNYIFTGISDGAFFLYFKVVHLQGHVAKLYVHSQTCVMLLGFRYQSWPQWGFFDSRTLDGPQAHKNSGWLKNSGCHSMFMTFVVLMMSNLGWSFGKIFMVASTFKCLLSCMHPERWHVIVGIVVGGLAERKCTIYK